MPVSEKQDVQERLADLVTKEEAKIPQLGILALTLDDKLMLLLPPLRNRFGVVVAGKETYGAYQGEGPLPGDVIYSVNGTFVDSVDSLRSRLDDRQSRCRLNDWAVFTISFSKQINSYITQLFPFLFSAKE